MTDVPRYLCSVARVHPSLFPADHPPRCLEPPGTSALPLAPPSLPLLSGPICGRVLVSLPLTASSCVAMTPAWLQPLPRLPRFTGSPRCATDGCSGLDGWSVFSSLFLFLHWARVLSRRCLGFLLFRPWCPAHGGGTAVRIQPVPSNTMEENKRPCWWPWAVPDPSWVHPEVRGSSHGGHPRVSPAACTRDLRADPGWILTFLIRIPIRMALL